VISSFSGCVTSDGFFRSFGGDIRRQAGKSFLGDFYVMIKRTTLILSAATLSFGLALPSVAFAADDVMKKDTMSKDSMSKDSMKKDSMSKDSISKDTMSKDSMSKDSMKKDDMKN
jgi:pentapeptide MXKDX repeat protein